MLSYPLLFNAQSHSQSGMASTWNTSVSNGTLTCAIPPEFDGPGGGFSPEDLFVLAIANCFVATFKVIAEKSHLDFESLSVAGTLKVDKDANGHPHMKECHLVIDIKTDAAQKDRALRLLEKASNACLVARSIKTEMSYAFSVS